MTDREIIAKVLVEERMTEFGLQCLADKILSALCREKQEKGEFWIQVSGQDLLDLYNQKKQPHEFMPEAPVPEKPSTFMGYGIQELQDIINFARSKGYEKLEKSSQDKDGNPIWEKPTEFCPISFPCESEQPLGNPDKGYGGSSPCSSPSEKPKEQFPKDAQEQVNKLRDEWEKPKEQKWCSCKDPSEVLHCETCGFPIKPSPTAERH